MTARADTITTIALHNAWSDGQGFPTGAGPDGRYRLKLNEMYNVTHLHVDDLWLFDSVALAAGDRDDTIRKGRRRLVEMLPQSIEHLTLELMDLAGQGGEGDSVRSNKIACRIPAITALIERYRDHGEFARLSTLTIEFGMLTYQTTDRITAAKTPVKEAFAPHYYDIFALIEAAGIKLHFSYQVNRIDCCYPKGLEKCNELSYLDRLAIVLPAKGETPVRKRTF